MSATYFDELGYLPIDKLGADLLFQVISERYQRGAILMSEPIVQNLASKLQQRHHADLRAA